MTTVAVIVGSLRKDSINRRLALALRELAAPRLDLKLLRIDDIPLYNQDLESDLPEAVRRFKAEIEAADAVLFVTPEYNRSIPGVLKNLIDWGSRPFGKSSWNGKPGAIAGTSQGAIATAAAQGHLRDIAVVQGIILMGRPEVYVQFKEGLIEADGTITDDSTRGFLESYTAAFADWIERTRA